jgi:glycosyltransferase involved in cell wall biosynthesis
MRRASTPAPDSGASRPGMHPQSGPLWHSGGPAVPRRDIRCLLFAPIAPPDPRNGDAQYTEDLLRSPPEGVRYVSYTDALASGELEWGPSVKDAKTWRSPIRRLPTATLRAALHAGRTGGLLLPDPVRWIRVRGRFDLVHVHIMPVRFLGPRPPVLLSDSAGTFWYWSGARGLPETRVRRLLRRERLVARAVGYLHPTVNPAGEGLLFFIESGVALAAQIGVDASTAVICAPGVPPARGASRSDGHTFLFVGRDFALKGGPDADRIVAQVRAHLHEARLLVAGPDEPATVPDGVDWLGPLSRERLYDEVYPRADVFLYPTTSDCAPLVVQEALAHGLPILAPRIMGMPDLVRHGETGYLFEPGNLEEAASAAIALLTDHAALRRMRAAAARDFEQRFSIRHRNEVLGATYRSLVP